MQQLAAVVEEGCRVANSESNVKPASEVWLKADFGEREARLLQLSGRHSLALHAPHPFDVIINNPAFTRPSLFIDIINDARRIIGQEKGVCPDAQNIDGTTARSARLQKAIDEIFRLA